MAGLCGGDRGGGRLRVTHLADQEDIDILSEGRGERSRKIFRINTHFALVDEGLFGLKNVLDRVFDRHDMLHPLGVDELDERGKRGRLPLPYRADDKKESLRFAREGCQRLRQVELLYRTNGFRDKTKCDRDGTALEKCIPAKADTIVRLIGKVELLLSEKALFLLGSEKRMEKSARGEIPARGSLCLLVTQQSQRKIFTQIHFAHLFICQNFSWCTRSNNTAFTDDIRMLTNIQCFTHIMIGN